MDNNLLNGQAYCVMLTAKMILCKPSRFEGEAMDFMRKAEILLDYQYQGLIGCQNICLSCLKLAVIQYRRDCFLHQGGVANHDPARVILNRLEVVLSCFIDSINQMFYQLQTSSAKKTV